MASPPDPDAVDQTLASEVSPKPAPAKVGDTSAQPASSDATANGPEPIEETLPPPPVRAPSGQRATYLPIRIGPAPAAAPTGSAPSNSDETLPSATTPVSAFGPAPVTASGTRVLPDGTIISALGVPIEPLNSVPVDANETLPSVPGPVPVPSSGGPRASSLPNRVAPPVPVPARPGDTIPDPAASAGPLQPRAERETPAADADATLAHPSGYDAPAVPSADPTDPYATLPRPGGRTVASGDGFVDAPDEQSDATVPTLIAGRPGSAPTETGTMVGRFALKGLHASGGLGEVFTARDTELNREVAVKRIKSRYADDPGSRRRFLTEAELTARLDHPGVVPVFGLVNDARGRPVYAMRFIRGETLKDEIDRYHHQGPGARGQGSAKTEKDGAPETKAAPAPPAAPAPVEKEVPRTVAFRHLLSRFVSVCQAIAYAHEKGIIHRDIKPANVMVGKFGEVLVVDWGLAKSLTDGPDLDRIRRASAEAAGGHDPDATELPSHMTMAGTAVGTPAFMPPEQAAGEVDKVGPRADVYSLGATLFAILTGRAPFVGKSAPETLEQVRRGAFEPPAVVNTGCPKPLDAICRKAMALDPNDRYATAQALAADVERWLSDEPVVAYPDPFFARLARWSRRHPTRVATGVSLLLAGVVAAGGIAWAVNEGRKNTQTALDLVTIKEKETADERDKVKVKEKETADALAQVTKEKAKTDAANVLVGRALELARKRYEKAVEAYNTLVHDLDLKLADRAGMQATRKTLLLNATEGLKTLIEGKGEGNIGADRTLVAAHRQMGEVYQIVGQTADALEQFGKAVQVAELVLTNAGKTDDPRPPAARADDVRAARRDLARSLDRLAGIHLQAGDTGAALEAIDRAITLFEELAGDKADAVAQQELASARDRRAKILLERGDTTGAAAACQRTLAARRELSTKAPDNLSFKRALAASLDALAGVQLRTGDTAGAEVSAGESRTIREELAPKFPPDQPDVQRELADSHARLGEVHFDRALVTTAVKDYEAGIGVLAALVKRDPQNVRARADLAALSGRLGYAQLRTGDFGAALANTLAGKEECERLLKSDPDSAKARRDLALARQRYGDALLASGSPKDGLAEFVESEKLTRALRVLDAGNAEVKVEHSRCWEHIGDGRVALKDPKGAVAAFAESVKIREQARIKDPGSASIARDLAVGLYKQADAYCAAGKPAEANKLASDATTLLVDLAAANKESRQVQRDLALAYGKWGQVLAGDGHPTGALLVWHSSLDRFQKLAAVDTGNFQAKEEEAEAWERLAGFHAKRGGTTQALASARNAVALWAVLGNRADTRTKAGLRRLALAQIRCGDIYTEVRQFSDASDWYTKALDEVKALGSDPLLKPVNDLATEKLVFLEAVKLGLSNPRNLTDKKFDAVRISALQTVGMLEVRADRAPEAASAADELAKVATSPEDRFAVARVFAGCVGCARGTDSARDSDAKRAVAALKKAIDAGFMDADALTGAEWAAVRARAPEFAKVQSDLIQRRKAAND